MFLCGYKSYYGGNFIPSLMAIEDRLVDIGWRCVYVFPNESRDRYWIQYMQKQNRSIQFIDFSQRTNVFISSVKRIAEDRDVEIIHTHFVKLIHAELLSFSCNRSLLVAHIHSDFSQGRRSLKSQIKNYIIYNILSVKTRIISVSPDLASKYNKHCIWISNALANERIPCSSRTREMIRNQHSISSEMRVIEVFGWSPDVKGVDIAVDAVSDLWKTGVKVVLAIVCGRQMTPERMRDYISHKTDCNGDESFLVYWEPNEDVYGYHMAADVLLSSSRSEGFSYAVLEMLDVGKPCVLSDIPGVQWAKEFSNTYFYNPDDKNALLSCLNAAIEDHEIDLSKNASLIADKYNIDAWVAKIIEVYKIQ